MHPGGCGRVGHRRNIIKTVESPPTTRLGGSPTLTTQTKTTPPGHREPGPARSRRTRSENPDPLSLPAVNLDTLTHHPQQCRVRVVSLHVRVPARTQQGRIVPADFPRPDVERALLRQLATQLETAGPLAYTGGRPAPIDQLAGARCCPSRSPALCPVARLSLWARDAWPAVAGVALVSLPGRTGTAGPLASSGRRRRSS
ncbi:hypothetical protein ACVWY0_004496 [Arthrobacter sp. UYNi723]